MASLVITNTFSPNTTILSNAVNTNYTDISTYINNRNSGAASWDVVNSVAAVSIAATTNQLILGTTRTVTLTAPTPASASRTITIPDLTGDYSLVGTIGAQSLAGVKTFTGGAGAITMSSSTIAMGSNKITGLANATTAGDALSYGQLAPGIIKQIVSTAAFTGNTISSTSFVDMTGASVSITPGATTSKVLVVATFTVACDGTQTFNYTLLRGSTNLGDATEGWNRMASPVANKPTLQTIVFLDSPATTSSTTYKLQAKVASGSLYAGNFSGAAGNNLYVIELGQ